MQLAGVVVSACCCILMPLLPLPRCGLVPAGALPVASHHCPATRSCPSPPLPCLRPRPCPCPAGGPAGACQDHSCQRIHPAVNRLQLPRLFQNRCAALHACVPYALLSSATGCSPPGCACLPACLHGLTPSAVGVASRLPSRACLPAILFCVQRRASSWTLCAARLTCGTWSQMCTASLRQWWARR